MAAARPRLRARAAQTGAPVSRKRTAGKAASAPASSRPTTMTSAGGSVWAMTAASARASVGAFRLGMMTEVRMMKKMEPQISQISQIEESSICVICGFFFSYHTRQSSPLR